MSMPYLGESTDAILGQEFLTWLWYQSDTAPGAFTDSQGAPFSVSMEQRIVVQGGEGEARETASVSGSLSPLREARFGLGTGQKGQPSPDSSGKGRAGFSTDAQGRGFQPRQPENAQN